MPEQLENQPDYFVRQIASTGLYYKDDLSKQNISGDVIAKVPKDVAAKYHIIPIFIDRGILVLVTDTEQALKNVGQIENILDTGVRLLLGSPDNVKMALLDYYDISSYRQKNFTKNGIATTEDDGPLRRKIYDMIQLAAEKKASDIHFLPYSGGIYVQFRINGHMIDLSDQYGFSPAEAMNVINIIKGMDKSGNADISKANIPNNGSFSIRRGDVPIYVRMATVPIGAEIGLQKVNLRLLPQTNKRINLNDIGYPPKDLQIIKNTLYRSATGLFINSGPTGSGKTTSLYAQMYYVEDIVNEPLNIMCIENPIEIKEEKFTQVQVREVDLDSISLTAEKILKVGLRSDPDIFLYGEIRDRGDAVVAIEASTTGHRVFSTVHASDCIRTITRLLDLEVSKMSLLSELRMIISQRLVGILCPACSQPHTLTPEEKAILSPEELEMLTAPGVHLREQGSIKDQKSCKKHCQFGFQGRTAVDEYVIFDTPLRDALLTQKSFSDVQKVLRDRGFQSMWEKGLEMVKTGQVALSEIIHVVGKD